MSKKEYNSLKELFDDVIIIRDRLTQCGANSAATELTEILECYWTTSSEAIVELLTSFEAVSSDCANNFSSEENDFVADVREGAKALLNFQ